MTSIDQVFDSVGLIIVVTEVVKITRVRRREVRSTETRVNFGSGFIVDGNVENGLLRNTTSSNKPIIITVAHLIPTEGTSQYYIKLFDRTTKISKIYPLQLESYNRGIDVCIFQFVNAPVNIDCLQWNVSSIKSGDVCYLSGYPLGDSQLSIVSGSVRDPTYCFTNLASGVDQIYHSVPATGGNSGSCILDKDNKIIGIHAWGYIQGPNGTFENFSGGPSTHSVYPILSHMIQNKNLAVNKYYPRVTLCVNAQILDDLFRIQNITNPNLVNLDGLIIRTILNNISSYTVHAHNLRPGTTKIAVNDLITSIFDWNKNEYVSVGYSKEAPLNILFTHPLTSSIKIKLRKTPLYDVEHEIILTNPFVSTVAQDSFYSNFL